MPRGACVVEYVGKRGTVWRVRYVDAHGVQIQETLGPESQGWNRKKAEAELRERLVRVERKGYRRPGPLTFAAYSDSWFREGPAGAVGNLQPSRSTRARSTDSRTISALSPSPRSDPATSPSTSPSCPRTVWARRRSPATSRFCKPSSRRRSGRNLSSRTRPNEPSGRSCRDERGGFSSPPKLRASPRRSLMTRPASPS